MTPEEKRLRTAALNRIKVDVLPVLEERYGDYRGPLGAGSWSPQDNRASAVYRDLATRRIGVAVVDEGDMPASSLEPLSVAALFRGYERGHGGFGVDELLSANAARAAMERDRYDWSPGDRQLTAEAIAGTAASRDGQGAVLQAVRHPHLSTSGDGDYVRQQQVLADATLAGIGLLHGPGDALRRCLGDPYYVKSPLPGASDDNEQRLLSGIPRDLRNVLALEWAGIDPETCLRDLERERRLVREHRFELDATNDWLTPERREKNDVALQTLAEWFERDVTRGSLPAHAFHRLVGAADHFSKNGELPPPDPGGIRPAGPSGPRDDQPPGRPL
jgi:hypothetical protein